jgi:hypothetical protein
MVIGRQETDDRKVTGSNSPTVLSRPKAAAIQAASQVASTFQKTEPPSGLPRLAGCANLFPGKISDSPSGLSV